MSDLGEITHPDQALESAMPASRFGFSSLQGLPFGQPNAPQGWEDDMSRVEIAWLALGCPLFSWAQTTSSAGAPARMLVTVGHYYGHQLPVLTRDDLTVTQRFDPLPVTNLVPLRGDR